MGARANSAIVGGETGHDALQTMSDTLAYAVLTRDVGRIIKLRHEPLEPASARGKKRSRGQGARRRQRVYPSSSQPLKATQSEP